MQAKVRFGFKGLYWAHWSWWHPYTRDRHQHDLQLSGGRGIMNHCPFSSKHHTGTHALSTGSSKWFPNQAPAYPDVAWVDQVMWHGRVHNSIPVNFSYNEEMCSELALPPTGNKSCSFRIGQLTLLVYFGIYDEPFFRVNYHLKGRQAGPDISATVPKCRLPMNSNP